MSDVINRQEFEKVIEVGQDTLNSLYSAQVKLNSAKSWRVLDKYGGSFLTSMMKHSKKEEARSYLELARQDVLFFQRELKAMHFPQDIKKEVGGFLSFASFFLDGAIEDYMLHPRMTDAQEELGDAIQIVANVCLELKNWSIENCEN